MRKNITIIDGYVDEPTCLGVPPYISTYPRYIAGALVYAGIPEENIAYTTIDKYRESDEVKEKVLSSDVVIVVCGITVPGRYLGGTPITMKEIETIGNLPCYKIIGGPVTFGFALKGGTRARPINIQRYNLTVTGDIELASYFIGKAIKENTSFPEGIFKHRRTADFIDRIAHLGAFIVNQHPYFPHVICEIETFRGCERKHHCSYCTEPFYGKPDHRKVEGIIKEIFSLRNIGIKHFRIGRQPNLLGYMSYDAGKEFTIPNPEAIKELFERTNKLNIETLHIDNINAGTIVHFPEASSEAITYIATYDTEGDVAALGLESADPQVIKANNLKVNAEEMKSAIKVINKIGGFKTRRNGTYKLLPGINFLAGLKGETKKTFIINMDFLKSIVDEGILLRRINIRQVMLFPGTPLGDEKKHPKPQHYKEFERFKRFVREEIDLPMMKKVFPTGTVIKNAITQAHDKEHTLARPLGTYPIVARIPEKLPLKKSIDIVVVGHRERSVIGLPLPIRINTMSHKAISFIPGISRKLSSDIIISRPFKNKNEILKKFPMLEKFSEYISL